MTAAEFRRLADAHRIGGRTREALELVEVHGETAYRAAQIVDIEQSAISRARRKIARPLCPHCLRPM